MDMKFLKVRRMLGTRSLLDGNDAAPTPGSWFKPSRGAMKQTLGVKLGRRAGAV